MSISRKEEYVLQRIVVASENDPMKPEFPPDDPRFPATPTRRIHVPGFKNIWLKDESKNLTGFAVGNKESIRLRGRAPAPNYEL